MSSYIWPNWARSSSVPFSQASRRRVDISLLSPSDSSSPSRVMTREVPSPLKLWVESMLVSRLAFLTPSSTWSPVVSPAE